MDEVTPLSADMAVLKIDEQSDTNHSIKASEVDSTAGPPNSNTPKIENTAPASSSDSAPVKTVNRKHRSNSSASATTASCEPKFPEFTLDSGKMETSQYRQHLKACGFDLGTGIHVLHIIASANGGADHAWNYHWVGHGRLNSSVQNRCDAFYCYLAGRFATQRAVEASLKHGKLKQSRKYGSHSTEWLRDHLAEELFCEGQELFGKIKEVIKEHIDLHRAAATVTDPVGGERHRVKTEEDCREILGERLREQVAQEQTAGAWRNRVGELLQEQVGQEERAEAWRKQVRELLREQVAQQERVETWQERVEELLWKLDREEERRTAGPVEADNATAVGPTDTELGRENPVKVTTGGGKKNKGKGVPKENEREGKGCRPAGGARGKGGKARL
ncbi:hypothetical protein HK104_000288 [Borealophlyctis nickersoniae]|nr:hypothetical protein HK104_000288 [Borealophlyctis nickersoniae]